MAHDLEGLPGWELVGKGLDDLSRGEVNTPEALLVAMASLKLQGLGLQIPALAFEVADPELKLYALLGQRVPDPYHDYQALRNRLGRFERAFEAQTSRARHDP